MIKQLVFICCVCTQLTFADNPDPTPDPNCDTGIAKAGSLGTACCPDECGACGGATGIACGLRPGGSDDCCYGGQGNGGIFDHDRYCDEVGPPCIVRFDPFCENPATGILKINAPQNGGGAACCPATCGICGSQSGLACSGQPGGAQNCCFGAVSTNGLSCEFNPPPCVPLE